MGNKIITIDTIGTTLQCIYLDIFMRNAYDLNLITKKEYKDFLKQEFNMIVEGRKEK